MRLLPLRLAGSRIAAGQHGGTKVSEGRNSAGVEVAIYACFTAHKL